MVKETCSTIGTGTFTLAGALSGYRSFSDVGDSNGTFYHREDTNGNWENGSGIYSGGTLTRTVVSNSLGTTALINFPDTTGFIDLTVPAALFTGTLYPNVATTNVVLQPGNEYLNNCGATLFNPSMGAGWPLNSRCTIVGNPLAAGGWQITQLAGQRFWLAGGQNSTLGVTGYVASPTAPSLPGSSIEFRTIVANTDFLITFSSGEISYN